MEITDIPQENLCSILTWNVQWAAPKSSRGRELRLRIEADQPDIFCITEGFPEFMEGSGYMIMAEPDFGYPVRDDRRKVFLWSREPWSDVDTLGNEEMPSGRFVSGITNTRLGPLLIVGVCIPWRHAHVASGRRDRRLWQDHRSYLTGLREFLNAKSPLTRCIVLGDFNQRMPMKHVPVEVGELLSSVFEGRLSFATKGVLPLIDKNAIDHITHSDDLVAIEVEALPAGHAGKMLSDHFGVRAILR